MIDTAHEAFVSMDTDGIIIDWNHEAERTFGWSREEAVGGNLAETIVPPEHREAHRLGLERLLDTGEGPVMNKRIELVALHRDGHEFPVEVTISATGSDERQCFHAFLHDVTERKLREDELQESQRQLAQAQRLAYIGSWEWSIEADELSWSDELYLIFGLEPQTFIGGLSDFLGRVHPGDRARVDRAIKQALQDHARYEFDHRILRADGTVRILHALGEVITGEDGEPVKLAGTGHDITDARRLEEESTRFWNLSLDLLSVSGFDGVLKRVNPAHSRLFGYSEQELIGKPYVDFIHPDDRERVLAVTRALASGDQETAELELQARCKDGSHCSLLTSARSSPDHELIYTVGRDVTERKRAEEALRKTQERYRVLVEGVTDYAIYLLDPVGHIASWSPGAERITGYTTEEVVGQHFSLFYEPADVERGHTDQILQQAADDGRYEEEGWRVRKDGSRFWATVVVTALRDEKGGLQGFSKITRDITERKQARDEALLARELAIGFGEAETLEQALENTLRNVCKRTGWILGQAWICHDSGQLECSSAWYATSDDVEPFRRRSESITFERWSGLPGVAYATKEPAWIEDVRSAPNFPRAPFAREVGLGSGVAFPMLADGEPVVVLEFFLREAREKDERLVTLVSAAAAHLGTLIRRKQAERDLRVSEERFRLLVESVEDYAIFMLDPNGAVASWNQAAERITGYSAAEILGYHVSRFYTPEAVEEDQPERQLKDAADKGRSEKSDWRVRKDGLHFWANVVITPLRNEQGGLRGFSHVARDITVRRQIEEELDRLGAIVEHSEDAIISTTPGNGVITSWNSGAERLFGYSERDVVGRRISIIIPPALRDEQRKIVERVLAGERVEYYETRSVRRDGSHVDVSLSVSPIKDLHEAVVGISAIARDVTDVKRAQQLLEDAFGSYVDRDVVDHILKQGPSLAGEEVDVTLMFMDVCGFTSFSKRMEPPEVIATLNELFGLVVPIITGHHGHVDKFMGDGLLAVFGTPRPEPDHADRALRTAIEIDEAVREKFGGELRIGIGIDLGRVIAGNVGGGGRLDFTVIGHAVNMAARVEAATRKTGDTILVAESTRAILESPPVPLQKRTAVALKGIRDPVDLYAPVANETDTQDLGSPAA